MSSSYRLMQCTGKEAVALKRALDHLRVALMRAREHDYAAARTQAERALCDLDEAMWCRAAALFSAALAEELEGATERG